MQFDIESRQAKLELRILELEDTVASLTRIARSLHEMLTDSTISATDYAARLGGLLLTLPSTAPKRMWPTIASTLMTGEPGAGSDPHQYPGFCGGCAAEDQPPAESP